MDKTTIASIFIALIIGFVAGYVLNSGSDYEVPRAEKNPTIWSCSMHSQIQLAEPGQCPICAMDLIPQNGGGKSTNTNAVVFNEGEIRQNNIQVIEVGTSEVSKAIHLDGKVKINENNIIVQSSHYAGRIEVLSIKYKGQLVTKGQLIAKIYSPDLIKAQTELIQAASFQSRNPELFSAAKKKLTTWKISEKQINQIIKSGKAIKNLPVYADYSGIITELKIASGNYVKKGEALVHLTNLNSVWIELDAFERDLEWLKLGQSVRLKIQTATQSNYKGTINYIAPFLNANTRTVKVRVELKNNGDLKPEMLAVGEVLVQNRTSDLISIPKSALLWTGERSVIYKEIEHHTFTMQQIVLGENNGDFYIVKSGLNKGDRIAKSGTFVIDAAAQLQGKPSMMNQSKAVIKMDHSILKNNGSIFSMYIEATDALRANHEKHVKNILAQILDSIPDLKTKHPQLLQFEGDKFKLAFSNFSLSFKATYKNSEKMYLIKCPMANSDKGGYWLSSKPEVDNPYFGGAMLKCGNVINK